MCICISINSILSIVCVLVSVPQSVLPSVCVPLVPLAAECIYWYIVHIQHYCLIMLAYTYPTHYKPHLDITETHKHTGLDSSSGTMTYYTRPHIELQPRY